MRPPASKRYTAVLRITSLLILIVFMAGGLLSGYLFYETVRMVVASVPLNPVQDVPAAVPVENSFVNVEIHKSRVSSATTVSQVERMSAVVFVLRAPRNQPPLSRPLLEARPCDMGQLHRLAD